MVQSLPYLKETPSQTAGPYVHIGCTPNFAEITGVFEKDLGSGPLVNDKTRGERITIRGRVIDGTGTPLRDAMVEIWQADPDGRYDSSFHGFGRCATDAEGRYRFVTLRPGAVPGPGNSTQAAHVVISIFARGLMKGLMTRAYFAGDLRLAEDAVLALVPAPRRGTMIATPAGGGEWRLDIRLQGEGETVFLDV